MIVDTNQFYKCETCRHHKYYGCNTWCDSGESYSPDIRKLKPVDFASLGYVKIEKLTPKDK